MGGMWGEERAVYCYYYTLYQYGHSGHRRLDVGFYGPIIFFLPCDETLSDLHTSHARTQRAPFEPNGYICRFRKKSFDTRRPDIARAPTIPDTTKKSYPLMVRKMRTSARHNPRFRLFRIPSSSIVNGSGIGSKSTMSIHTWCSYRKQTMEASVLRPNTHDSSSRN